MDPEAGPATTEASVSKPLSRRETLDVLRYWLAALRHEEALAVRPRAATRGLAGRERAGPPDLRQPGEGQGYFKLVPGEVPGAADLLLKATRELTLPADGERLGLFERWLRNAYRREQAKHFGAGRDPGTQTWLAGFPVIHFAAAGELATLLRFVVDDVVWRGADERAWAPPPFRERRAGAMPPLPERLSLRLLSQDDAPDVLPYAVDADLLSRTLGIDEERVEDFLGALRQRENLTPVAMVAAVRDLLLDREPAETMEESPAEALAGLTAAVHARLVAVEGPRARVYPVGLVYDGTRQYTTWHLQRDLQTVLTHEVLGDKRSALGAYLAGRRPVEGTTPRLGLRPDGHLPTADQQAAAERFLGSTLTAAQGPPGSGKTEVILDLVADTLVTRARSTLGGGGQRWADRPLLMVASTNNRAVDNAVDPLGRDAPAERLPLTLRTGNREITRTITASQLERVQAWLATHDDGQAVADYEAARASFDLAWRALEATPQATSESPPSLVQARVTAERAAFDAAAHLRERWALLHAETLRVVLDRARESCLERGSLRPIFEDDTSTGQWLRRLFPAFGCTLLSLGNVFPMAPDAFERLVIDEAGQCHPAYAVAGLYRCTRALVIGDVHQLEPVYGLLPNDEARVRQGLRTTLDDARFAPYRVGTDSRASAQVLADRAAGRMTLRDHFRCQPAIIALSDALCGYELRVLTPPRSRSAEVPWLHGPVLLHAVRGEQTASAGSWANEAEIEVVVQMVADLRRRGVDWTEVAVITPYRAQFDALRRRLRGAGIPTEEEGGGEDLPMGFGGGRGGVALGTVHRFQGGERSVVLFSTVVARERSLQFLNDRVNLVNVAVSRARDHLVVIGDPEALRGGRYTRLLVEHAAPTPARPLPAREGPW